MDFEYPDLVEGKDYYYDLVNDIRPEFRKFFSDEIEGMMDSGPAPWCREGDPACIVEYKLNNFGLRCDDFFEIERINHVVFAGCEKTVPQDVALEDGWAHITYSHLFKTEGLFRNLAYPGAGVSKISSNIFKYFKKYGNPHSLLLLTPELIRDQGCTNSDPKVFKPKIYNQYFDFSQSEARPAIEHNLVAAPNDQPLPLLGLKYLQTMRVLEQYCDVAGIKFLWTSWDQNTNKFLSNYEWENFFELPEGDFSNQNIAKNFINKYRESLA